MSHGDKVTKMPKGFSVIAKTENAEFAAIENTYKNIYGVQFHPEVIHSLEGAKLIENFVVGIAGCNQSWTMSNFKDQRIQEIRTIVGKDKVVCGLSGGVDSSVVAVLINEAIGRQLTCIFVNNGLLRKDEEKEVVDIFSNNFNINLVYVDAKDIFLSKLKGVIDPEQKRKIIGNTFIEIFDAEAEKIDGAKFLAQGTLYPDVIESLHPNSGSSQNY